MQRLFGLLHQVFSYPRLNRAAALGRLDQQLLQGEIQTNQLNVLLAREPLLGYALFLREGRSVRLTPEGEQLQRQAHLLMRQAKAFEAFARAVPDSAMQDIALVYDPFTPRAFLQALIAEMAAQKIRLSLTSASRDEAEALLASGEADLGICQARNRSVGNEMEWRALGAIDMDFYAADALFAKVATPVSLLDLSLVPQVVMHAASDEPVARRLQIAGHTLFTNEIEMLRGLLEQGCGWGFLPTHLHATQWKNVKRLPTEVGNQGISQTMVTIWKPGSDKRERINQTLSRLPALWKRSAL
ncbi:LysR substrate-binding domain-containing protein [Enterobacter cloacae]|uniref:LysR substrate-binding domain-containing protein n=1 Tax=Enterobacter cloacae TaxID=550 RepID=UPI00374F7142